MMNLCFNFNLRVFIFLVCFRIPICCFDTNKSLFVFGDSLFDPGNNNYHDPGNNNYHRNLYRADHRPYGESYFKHPSGRFSDGRIIPDFIAEFRNLPMIPSYYQALHNHSIHGVNFASAGAGCLDQTYAGKAICLNTQLRHFKDVAERLKSELGIRNLKKYLQSPMENGSTSNFASLDLHTITSKEMNASANVSSYDPNIVVKQEKEDSSSSVDTDDEVQIVDAQETASGKKKASPIIHLTPPINDSKRSKRKIIPTAKALDYGINDSSDDSDDEIIGKRLAQLKKRRLVKKKKKLSLLHPFYNLHLVALFK